MKKRKLFFCVIILIFILFFIIKVFFLNNNNANESLSFENKFKISQKHYYSDISANNKTTYQNAEWNLDIYQYTDIAIYVERIGEYDSSNYIKELYLDNFKISDNNLKNKKLFYLNPLDFGMAKNDLDTIINNKLEYTVVNAENKKNDMTYGMPIYFEDCSNPITIRYVNDKIVENYKIENTEILEFNGSLLKKANIKLDELYTEISFTLNIITKDDEIHAINERIEIPLKNKDETIYEKSIDIVDKNNNEF